MIIDGSLVGNKLDAGRKCCCFSICLWVILAMPVCLPVANNFVGINPCNFSVVETPRNVSSLCVHACVRACVRECL